MYWSNIIVCLFTFTKDPLIKYTPSSIEAAEPVVHAFNEIVDARVPPLLIVVLP